MKNKAVKNLLNGVLLAAIAAVGITSYQLITSPVYDDEIIHDEMQMEMVKRQEEGSEESLVDVDTEHVIADVQRKNQQYENDRLKNDKIENDNLQDMVTSLEQSENEIQEDEEDIADHMESETYEQDSTETSVAAQGETSEETVSTAANVSIPAAAYLSFSENTVMEWPVHGNILLDYDMDQTTYFPTLDQYRMNPAISVQAVEGAPVTASVDGVVYQIENDPRTGMTVTMELGHGYQAIYGQLKDLNIQEGETVERGTVIGYIDTPTKYYSEEGTNLYFAMKKDGKPVDPILYLP